MPKDACPNCGCPIDPGDPPRLTISDLESFGLNARIVECLEAMSRKIRGCDQDQPYLDHLASEPKLVERLMATGNFGEKSLEQLFMALLRAAAGMPNLEYDQLQRAVFCMLKHNCVAGGTAVIDEEHWNDVRHNSVTITRQDNGTRVVTVQHDPV